MTGLEPELPSFLAFGAEMPEYLQNKKPQLWLICSSKDWGGASFLLLYLPQRVLNIARTGQKVWKNINHKFAPHLCFSDPEGDAAQGLQQWWTEPLCI